MIKKRRGQLVVTFVLLTVSIILLIYSKNKVDIQDIDYEKVKVTVISAEAEKYRRSGHSYYTYNVVVEYDNVRYDLINVQSSEMAKYEGLANLDADVQHDNPYFDNTVYFSNGKMYSNIAGIKTDSKAFDWKMVGMAGVFIFGTLHLMCVVDVIDRKKKLKDEFS